MLHELLLALSGNCGGVFIKKEKNKIQVAADIPFIHESEVILLNRICKLGSYYCDLQEFIENSSKVFDSSQNVKTTGLYIQAYCIGLDQILEDYRHSLVLIEDKVLRDPCLPLSFVEHSLEEYQVLLPSLASLTDQIKTQKANGCKILDILHKASICGIPHVKDAFERILYVCHGVLYQQLSAWLLHGLLIDSRNEFIITKATPGNTQNPKIEDQTDSDMGIGGITGKQLSEVMEGDSKATIPVLWQFKINAEMLPSYIPTRVADKILFVGDSVKMFEDAQTGKDSNRSKSIVYEKEEEFLRSLYSLQQRSHFSLISFENEIDKIRTYVAQHLWKLVVEDANLLKHLQIIKDYFLLGRGELFSVFMEHAQHLLKIPPSNSTSFDVNTIFQQVLHKFVSDDDESSSLFTLVIDMEAFQNKKTNSQDQVIVGWDCLNVQYDVQWPLHILFQKPILEKYNSLFRHLLNVKRTQQDLQRVWARHMGTKHQSDHFSHMTRVWLLRMHMAFLVDNLQYYLQVDVLEAQFTQLIEKINSTQDFEAVRLAHDHFVTTLMSQSFLLLKPVAHCLEEILTLCKSYCALLLQITDKLSDRENAQIEVISKNYERQSSLLFKILSSVRGYQATPHLAQLLLRIDFNKQFSSSSSLSFSRETLSSGSSK